MPSANYQICGENINLVTFTCSPMLVNEPRFFSAQYLNATESGVTSLAIGLLENMIVWCCVGVGIMAIGIQAECNIKTYTCIDDVRRYLWYLDTVCRAELRIEKN